MIRFVRLSQVAIVFALTASALLGSCVSARATAEDANSAEQVEALVHDWAAARVRGDVAFLESFYAREMRIHGTNGAVIARDDDIALFASGQIRPDYIRDEDVSVAIYGDSALVTGVERLGGTYGGVAGEGTYRFARVLTRREGRWQLVLSQGTWINPPSPSTP